LLKTRIIPTLLYRDAGLVKGVAFDSWRPVGSAMQAVKVYNMRSVDELVFLDITATPQGRDPDFDLIDDLADECFMPLAVGGGIRTVDDAADLLAVGADKVVLSTAAVETPDLVDQISNRFGAQCVIVSVDVTQRDGRNVLTSHCGKTPTDRDPVAFAREMESRGAGEILLQSVDRDGAMEGYDVPLLRSVADAVTIPVIASGGAGTYEHMAEAVTEGGASAVAAGAMFHFTEQTPLEAKKHLQASGVPVRL